MNVHFSLAAEQSWSSRARKVGIGIGIAAMAAAPLMLAAGSSSAVSSAVAGSATSAQTSHVKVLDNPCAPANRCAL
jgi:hypothetical protein